MAALEERGTHCVTQVRNNAVLKRLALPAINAVALYRERGKADGHLSELMMHRRPGPVVNVAPQEPLPAQGDQEAGEGVGPFACNQVRLLLAGFGYQIMHVPRDLLERVTGTGCSLRPLAERVLRTPARFTVSDRRITITTGGASAHRRMPARALATLHGPFG